MYLIFRWEKAKVSNIFGGDALKIICTSVARHKRFFGTIALKNTPFSSSKKTFLSKSSGAESLLALRKPRDVHALSGEMSGLLLYSPNVHQRPPLTGLRL